MDILNKVFKKLSSDKRILKKEIVIPSKPKTASYLVTMPFDLTLDVTDYFSKNFIGDITKLEDWVTSYEELISGGADFLNSLLKKVNLKDYFNTNYLDVSLKVNFNDSDIIHNLNGKQLNNASIEDIKLGLKSLKVYLVLDGLIEVPTYDPHLAKAILDNLN